MTRAKLDTLIAGLDDGRGIEIRVGDLRALLARVRDLENAGDGLLDTFVHTEHLEYTEWINAMGDAKSRWVEAIKEKR